MLTSSVSFGLLWVDERTGSTGSGSERGNFNFLNLKFNERNFRVKVEAAPTLGPNLFSTFPRRRL